MASFKFNKHNVCINPNTIRRETGQCSFEIRTAICRHGKWVYGCDCNLTGCGFGTPCIDNAQYKLPSFLTERDAIKAACQEIRRYMDRHHMGSDPNVADKSVKLYDNKLASLLDEIERPKPKELSLFD